MRNINKFCKRCTKETKHRFVNDQRPNRKPYYSCTVCLNNNSKKHRKKDWFSYLAQKANVRKRKDSIKLTKEDIKNQWLKQNEKCALTNLDLNINDKWWKPSLDRIDSNKGYTLNNIRIVAWIINHSRGNLSDNEFIDMCIKITQFKMSNILDS